MNLIAVPPRAQFFISIYRLTTFPKKFHTDLGASMIILGGKYVHRQNPQKQQNSIKALNKTLGKRAFVWIYFTLRN